MVSAEFTGPLGLINRHEFVRIIEQALVKLGYDSVAQELERVSGIQMQAPVASTLQQHLVEGNWEEALQLLPQLLTPELGPGSEVEQEARRLILQQQFQEALLEGRLPSALQVLREQLAPLAALGGPATVQQLHQLTGLLLSVPLHGPPSPPAGPPAAAPPPPAGGGPQDQLMAAQPQGEQSSLGQGGGWGVGAAAAPRQALLMKLQAVLPPWLLIPDSRLEVLVEQALATQVARCPYHNTLLGPQRAAAAAAAAGPYPPTGHAAGSSLCPPRGGPALSLFTDYSAGLEALPSQCVQVVAEHRDEVWHCAFSHSGQRLATAGKDKRAIIWSVASLSDNLPPPPQQPTANLPNHLPPPQQPLPGLGSPPKLGVGAAARVGGGGAAAGQGGARPWPLAMLHVLSGHPAPVAFVSWSPDDRLLLTLSDDRVLCWEAASGQCCQTFSHHREAVTCCAWLPDSRRFATGSVDKMVCLMSVTGEELARWKRPYRVQDLAVSADGRCLVIAASDRHIHVLRLSDLREISLAESAPITCLALSADSVHLLVNLQNGVVHLWTLGMLAAPPLPPSGPFGPGPLPPALLSPQPPGSQGLSSSTGMAAAQACPAPRPRALPAAYGLPPSGSGGGGLAALGGGGMPRGHPGGGTLLPSSTGGAGGPPSMPWPAVGWGGATAGVGGTGGGAGAAEGVLVDPMDLPPSGPSLEYCQAADSASGTPRASAGRFVLRSSLGGAAATFVVQGSEDGRVAMWHRDSGALLLQLTGHTGSVNAVAWNPAQPAMMASVGDDATIRVWVSEAALAGPSNRRWSHLNA